MIIRKYDTDGLNYIRAEIEWTPTDTFPQHVSEHYNVPSGGMAGLLVKQEEYYMTLYISPDDVLYDDKICLQILPGSELPKRFIGATFPASHYDLPYIILPLDDTKFGFALNVGIVDNGS